MKRTRRSIMALLLTVCMVVGYGFSMDGAYAAAKKSPKKAKSVKVQSVTLNHKVYTIKKGKTVKLKATVLPKNAKKKDKKIKWTSNKKKIATVKSGKVKGKKL